MWTWMKFSNSGNINGQVDLCRLLTLMETTHRKTTRTRYLQESRQDLRRKETTHQFLRICPLRIPQEEINMKFQSQRWYQIIYRTHYKGNPQIFLVSKTLTTKKCLLKFNSQVTRMNYLDSLKSIIKCNKRWIRWLKMHSDSRLIDITHRWEDQNNQEHPNTSQHHLGNF